MAWSETLLEASFRGVSFDIISIDDSADQAIAEHAYPYLDGADIEDLGRGPRVIAIEAIFFGSDYEQRLQDFLKELAKPGAGELVHPVFGSIKNAQLRRQRIRHDADNVDQATVSLEFVENTPGNPFFERNLPSQKAEAIVRHGAIANAAATSGFADVVDRLRAANSLAPLDALRQSMTGPLLAAVAKVQGVLTSGLDVLAYPRAWGNDVSALVNGILDVRDFGSNLIADWESIKSDLSLFDIFSAPGAAQPAQISAVRTPTEAQAIATAAVTIKVNTAVGMADAAALVLAAEAERPTLSPIEIENITNTARTSIERAMEDVRAIYPLEKSRAITEPLKDQALAIQEAARAIIEIRPPLLERTIEAPGNLRLIAHRLYGDHTRAPELFRINDLSQPNFILAGDKLNAYAV